MMTKKVFLSEMIGTMILVFIGCSAAVFNAGGADSAAWVLTVATCFGLPVIAMAYTIGGISGCHINPAITLGVWLSGRMKASDAMKYMIAQVLGGILASAVIYAIVAGGTSTGGVTLTGANGFKEGAVISAFIAEVVFTFIFVLVVLGTTASNNGTPKFAGLAIGLTLLLANAVCIPITGASINPARSIGPALFEGGLALSQLWLFIVAPFVGAILSTIVWKLIGTTK